MIVTVEPARPIHVYELMQNLRPREQAILASIDDPARQIIDEIRHSTRAYAGLIDGEVACVWGMHVRTLLLDGVYLWMLTSRVVEEHPFTFVRHSQRMVETLHEHYATIEGFVWIDNPASAKWLKWLGATIEESSSLEGGLEFKLRRASHAQ